MKKTFLGLASAAVGMAMLPMSAQACGEVSITDMNWDSSAVVTEVSKFIMEQGYGCKVNKVPSSTVPAVTSIAENGTPDIATEIWVNVVPLYRELEEEGKVLTTANVLSDGGEGGWWIPDYLAEAHPELKTIEGVLANPQLVGNRFHNCPEGWGCRIENDNLITAFDVRDSGMEIFDHGSGETLATSIASAFSDKEPWFGYYWAPTAILGKYPMVKVDLGPIDAAAADCITRKDCENPQKTSQQPAEVITGITTDFSGREPAIAELMANVSFTNFQMNDVLAWKEENKASSEEAAVYFLTNYKDVWSDWLSDDARGKLSALLN